VVHPKEGLNVAVHPIVLGVLVAAALKKAKGASSAVSSPEGWAGGKSLGMLDLVAVDGAGHCMRRDAAMAFIAMRQQAQMDGVTLVVDSAFRTMAEQQALYDEYTSGARTDVVAKPGWSNHQGGIAVDVATNRGKSASYAWLLEHARSFGFYATVQSEPWHWEYRV
jgi:LAS superfamily LD-carboxypeptidase LdcB